MHLDPASIPLDGSRGTRVDASVSWDSELQGVGVVAIAYGEVDVNIGGGSVALVDGQGRDLTRGQGIFSVENLSCVAHVTRDDDDGPRTLRVHAEVKTADGLPA